MKITIDLNKDVMEEAVREYLDKTPIEDLDRDLALDYVLWCGCGFDDWMDADELRDKLTEEEREGIVKEFAIAMGEHIVDQIWHNLDLTNEGDK